jgi:hypothetical protein
MPTVPTWTSNNVQAQSGPNVRMNTDAPIEAFGGGAANRAGAVAANTIGQIGGQAAALADQARRDADETIRIDTMNQMRAAEREMFYGKDGAMNVRGKDALDLPSQYQERYQETMDKIGGSLTGQNRVWFERQRQNEWEGFAQKLEVHGAGEYNKYQDQVYKVGIETAKQQALDNYRNPEAVNQSIEDQKALTASFAARNGMDEEFVANANRHQVSETRSAIVKQLISDGNAYAADAYYRKHQDDFVDKAAVHNFIKPSLIEQQAQDISQNIFAQQGYTDKSSAFAAADKIKDPDLKKAVRSNLSIAIAMKEHDDEMKHTAKLDETDKFVRNGGRLRDAPTFGELTPDERAAFESIEKGVAGASKTTDVTKYAEYMSLPAADLGMKKYEELVHDLGPNVTNAQWNRVKERWTIARGAMNGDEKAKSIAATETEKDQMLFSAMKDLRVAGLKDNTTRKEMGSVAKQYYTMLSEQLDIKTTQYREQNKKSPDISTMRSWANEMVREQMSDVELKGRLWGTNTKKYIDLDESDRERVIVKASKIPDTDKLQMISYMKKNAKIPGLSQMSDDEILSAIKNPNSSIGQSIRVRMEKAQGQLMLGDNKSYKRKLLGE